MDTFGREGFLLADSHDEFFHRLSKSGDSAISLLGSYKAEDLNISTDLFMDTSIFLSFS